MVKEIRLLNILINYINNDLKTFKTAVFAVFIAVTASFGVSVISSAGRQLISNEMKAMGLNGMTTSVYNSNGENLTNISFYNTVTNLKDVSKVSPIIYDKATAVFSNGISAEIIGWGIDSAATDIISLKVNNGRIINNADIKNRSYVCMVDKKIAEKVYKRSNICGKNIMLTFGNTTAYFTVIGTVEKGSSILNSLTEGDVPGFIYLPYTTMSDLSNKSAFDQIIFTSNDTQQSAEEFKQKLVDENHIYRNHTIKLSNLSNQKEQISNISDTAFYALFAVSCVAVLVCSMSVGASVNTAVISKYRDIGIKISMGASRWNITKEFVTMAVLSCIIGIYAGVIFMCTALIIIVYILDFTFKIDFTLILLSVFATIFLTLIFSIMPSYNAARMSPIKALSRE